MRNTVEPHNDEKFGYQEFFHYTIAGFSAILQVQYLKSEDMVIRKLSANAGFSAILQYAIAGFYCMKLCSFDGVKDALFFCYEFLIDF